MGDIERITLGDYGSLDNLDEVSQGFQSKNIVLFDIKTVDLAALRDNQLSGKELEDYNAHLTDFLKACNTINLVRALESEKASFVCLISKWTSKGSA